MSVVEFNRRWFIIVSKIPEILRKLRTECGLTQVKVAKELGIDRSTYSYYELGKITPSFRTITHLAQLYNVDYTEILDADVQMMCDDFTKNADSLNDVLSYDDRYSQTQEENILIGLKLLSKEARDEVLNFVLSKVKEERKIKVKRKRRISEIN